MVVKVDLMQMSFTSTVYQSFIKYVDHVHRNENYMLKEAFAKDFNAKYKYKSKAATKDVGNLLIERYIEFPDEKTYQWFLLKWS